MASFKIRGGKVGSGLEGEFGAKRGVMKNEKLQEFSQGEQHGGKITKKVADWEPFRVASSLFLRIHLISALNGGVGGLWVGCHKDCCIQRFRGKKQPLTVYFEILRALWGRFLRERKEGWQGVRKPPPLQTEGGSGVPPPPEAFAERK